MSDLIFLKLGGSLITDKTGVEQLRPDVLARVAEDIAVARTADPHLRLVVGHGSGSFGHVAAARHHTRQGVGSAEQWQGFAQVGDSAARLNRHVVAALLAAGVPALSLSPFTVAVCRAGQVVGLTLDNGLQTSLDHGLVPVVYGDVAFDEVWGGTIMSTEEVMAALAETMPPRWLLLAGETPGVFDEHGEVVGHISAATLDALLPALGGSRGTDVTGGMVAKVRQMLDLTAAHDDLSVRIFSGLEPGLLARVLLEPGMDAGTLLR